MFFPHYHCYGGPLSLCTKRCVEQRFVVEKTAKKLFQHPISQKRCLRFYIFYCEDHQRCNRSVEYKQIKNCVINKNQSGQQSLFSRLHNSVEYCYRKLILTRTTYNITTAASDYRDGLILIIRRFKKNSGCCSLRPYY